MLNKKLFSIVMVFLVLGCIQQQAAEETKLQDNQGLGILLFGLPSNPSNPVIEVEKVPPNSRAFLSLILRNNAEGETAENIIVNLDNVEPFLIVECGETYEPTKQRTSECCGYQTIYDDLCPVSAPSGYKTNTPEGKYDSYRTHRMNQMRPDEELEFFWVLQSPGEEETANMYFEHTIYATVNYHYKTSIYTGIAAMSFQEYSSRKANQESLTGTSTSSAGELRIRSATTEPVLYSQDSPGSFILKLILNNQGLGIPDPEENINLTVEYDSSLVELNGETSMHPANQQEINWFNQEYDDSKTLNSNNLLIQEIEPINLISGTYLINVPFKMLESSSNYQILPFYIRVSYNYMLESQTNLGVIPN